MEWEAALHSCQWLQGLQLALLLLFFQSALDSTVWTCPCCARVTRCSPRSTQSRGRSCHSPHFLLPGVFLWPAFPRSHDRKHGSPNVKTSAPLLQVPRRTVRKKPRQSASGAVRAIRLESVCTAGRGFPDVGLPQAPPRPAPRSLRPLRALFRALRLRSARAAAASRGCP